MQRRILLLSSCQQAEIFFYVLSFNSIQMPSMRFLDGTRREKRENQWDMKKRTINLEASSWWPNPTISFLLVRFLSFRFSLERKQREKQQLTKESRRKEEERGQPSTMILNLDAADTNLKLNIIYLLFSSEENKARGFFNRLEIRDLLKFLVAIPFPSKWS